MGFFGAVSLIISIISLIVKFSSSGNDDNTYQDHESAREVDLFPETTLDGILNCYETFRVPNFNIRHLEFDLRNANSGKFTVKASQLEGNCLYLNVQFFDVFDRKSKSGEIQEFQNSVNTYFSINYLEDTNNVIIYGGSNFNQRIKEGYKTVAAEIRKVISP